MSRLHYDEATRTLYGAFRYPEFREVRSVRVRNVVEPRPKTVKPERRHMSRAAAAVLTHEAECTTDTKIRAALNRLARHGSD